MWETAEGIVNDLYESDIVEWSERQAGLLRHHRRGAGRLAALNGSGVAESLLLSSPLVGGVVTVGQ
jgi:hypothetical protein